MKTKFGEIRCTFFDEGKWYVDAWQTADDDEEGVCVATIDVKTFEVNYFDEKYKEDDLVLEVVKEKLKEIVNK